MSFGNDNSTQVSNRTGLLDRRAFVIALGTLMMPLAGCASRGPQEPSENTNGAGAQRTGIELPNPASTDAPSELLDVIERRRSVRSFTGGTVSEKHIATLLWAAQGITHPGRGLRAAPSAGALYPLETYVASAEGVRRYVPKRHELKQVVDHDIRDDLALAALGQRFIAEASVVFVITGVYARLQGKYGDRAARYTHLEAGHAAQNLLLIAVHLGLGGVPVGAFIDDSVRRLIDAAEGETPLYLIPVGTLA